MGVVRSSSGGELLFTESVLEVYQVQNVSTSYTVFLDEEITSPPKYRNVMNVLHNAGPDDVVTFHLNSIGGNALTALQISNGIYNTQARTVAICEGEVVSAATLPLLACDDVVVMPGSYAMVHAASWGTSGDVKSVRDSVQFSTKYLSDLLKDVYAGFLTEQEIVDVIENSKEYYMDSDEITRRLKVRQELIQKELEEIEKANLEPVVVEKPKRKSKPKASKTSIE